MFALWYEDVYLSLVCCYNSRQIGWIPFRNVLDTLTRVYFSSTVSNLGAKRALRWDILNSDVRVCCMVDVLTSSQQLLERCVDC